MKTLVRFCCVMGLLGLVVMPLSAVSRNPGQRGVRLRNHVGHARFTERGLTKAMGCSFDCGNGDSAYAIVRSQEECQNLCETFCGAAC
jgi:hypothetical protein